MSRTEEQAKQDEYNRQVTDVSQIEQTKRNLEFLKLGGERVSINKDSISFAHALKALEDFVRAEKHQVVPQLGRNRNTMFAPPQEKHPEKIAPNPTPADSLKKKTK